LHEQLVGLNEQLIDFLRQTTFDRFENPQSSLPITP